MSEKEITLDDMIKWVKKDPVKVRRIIRSERFIGVNGKMELYYHGGRCLSKKGLPHLLYIHL